MRPVYSSECPLTYSYATVISIIKSHPFTQIGLFILCPVPPHMVDTQYVNMAWSIQPSHVVDLKKKKKVKPEKISLFNFIRAIVQTLDSLILSPH